MEKILHSILIFITFMISGCESQPIQIHGKPYHHVEGGFRNPPGSIEPGEFSLDHLMFGITRPFVELYSPEIPNGHILDPEIALKQFFGNENKDSITWIGHMTVIIRLDKQIIAVDPWFTSWGTSFPPFGPKREVSPGIPLIQLPQFNTVVLSHNHLDHLDLSTLEQLAHPELITMIVPLGLGRYFKHIRFKAVIELDWHESKIINNITYTALPAVHFSKRTLFDTNETLWAGFSIKSSTGKKVFFCEAEYGSIYKQIGKKYGPFDIALIATGAYWPRKVMQGYHCTPEKCVQIALDLQAKILVPIHWGTVILGTEPFTEPGPLFKEEALKKGVSADKVWLMKIGETRTF